MSSLEFEVPRATYSQSAIAALFPRGTKVSIKSTDRATYVIVSTSQQYSQQDLGELYHKICSAQKPEHRVQPAQTHRGGHVQHGQHNGGHGQSAKHREYVRPEEFVHKGKSSVQTPRQGTMFTQGAWGHEGSHFHN